MAYSYTTATGTGAPQNVTVPPYIDKSHIHVYVNLVETFAFTWPNDNTVQLTAANGASIKVARKSSPGARLTDYIDGGSLTEVVLDNDSKQAFYLAQEQLDDTADALAVVNQPSLAALAASIQQNALDAQTAAANAASAAAGAVAGKLDASLVSAAALTVLDDASVGAMLATMGGAPLASPTLTGDPKAPTPAPGDNDTSIATTAFVTTAVANGVASVPVGMGKNRIINPAFTIDQRNAGASQSFTAGAALAYCADRWYGYCTGANITGQQVTVSGQRRYRFTGAASNTAVGLGQRIEAINSADLAGGNARLQVKLSSSSLTTVNWALYYASTTDSFGTLASPTRTLISSGSFTGVNATEALYSTASISIPAGATTGLELVLSGGALLASQTLTIGDVQLEAGSSVTPFERRTVGTELDLCQRYYERVGETLSSMIMGGGASLVAYATVYFKVTKRATPTIAAFGTFTISGAGGTQTNTASSPSIHSFMWSGGDTSGLNYIHNNAGGGYSATAEL